jgi:hypothetical protein
MQIEVEKIIAATNTLEVRLTKFNELEREAMGRQAEADAAAVKSAEARQLALSALMDLHQLSGEILARNAGGPGAHDQVQEILAGKQANTKRGASSAAK